MGADRKAVRAAAKRLAKASAREAARAAAQAAREEALAAIERAVPEPPWWSARRPPVRRSPLTRETIVQAATRILDRGEGLDALSMRRLGEELGTGAASIYWHVRNKDELLDLVLDAAIGDEPVPVPDPARWREQVKEIARGQLEEIVRRPWVAEVSLGRWPLGPNALRWTEGLLAIMRAGGVSARDASWMAWLLTTYVNGFAAELSHPLDNTGEPGDTHEQTMAQIRAHLESLPPERFPNLTGMIDDMLGESMEERFEFGLDLLLRGLSTRARPRKG